MITPSNKRQIKAKQYDNLVSSNSNTDIQKYSILTKTVIDWNYLEEEQVHSKTVEGFISAMLQCD